MRNTFLIAWSELKEIFKTRMLRLTFLVVSMVPLLYGGLYLWAFWDPYSHMQDLPVAVVNEDLGALKDGKTIRNGDDLVSTLKSNPVLKWDFVSKDDAEQGLEDRKYYIEVIIPSNFSQDIVSVDEEVPNQAKIEFKAREATNMLASQVTNRYVSELTHKVSNEVTKAYFEAVFDSSRKSALKVKEAADGAGQISGAMTSLKNGGEQISLGLGSALDGSKLISNNLTTASSGASSVASALDKISVGYGQFYSGIGQASDALFSINQGAGTVLNGQIALSSSLEQLSNGSTAANSGLVSSGEALNQAILDLQNLAVSSPALATDPTYLKAMAELSGSSNGLRAVSSAFQGINTGLSAAVSGSQKLAIGQKQVMDGTTELSAKTEELITGGKELQNGLLNVKSGAHLLESGVNQLSLGAKDLSNGLTQLQGGVLNLQAGQQKVERGGVSLASSLQEGASKALQETNPESVNKKLSVLSNPVTMVDTSVSKVGNYGSGFAPYFISLSLWVGALLMFFVVSVDYLNLPEKYTHRQAIFGKYFVLAGIGLIQAVLIGSLLQFGLGLQIAHAGIFYAFLTLMSWCFIAILQLLVGLAGDAGKFVGIVLLMLQLTSCAGTFPIETIAPFFQKINPWLPMTYTTLGLREIITGDNMHAIFEASMVLLGILILFIGLLSGLVKFIQSRKSVML